MPSNSQQFAQQQGPAVGSQKQAANKKHTIRQLCCPSKAVFCPAHLLLNFDAPWSGLTSRAEQSRLGWLGRTGSLAGSYYLVVDIA
mmetsp:Transcript_24395/g.60963  ORF Transcript_24395/g.60963 Transcript_24395/m.60963 type:complete len:86 (-) Transcript_24395:112-369(-)